MRALRLGVAVWALVAALACGAAAPVPSTPQAPGTGAAATLPPTDASPSPVVGARTATPSATDTETAALAATLADDAWGFLTALTRDASPRESATDEEAAAADYLLRRLADMGYTVRLQPFSSQVLSTDLPPVLVDSAPSLRIEASPLARTGLGGVSGPLAHVALALAGDVPASGLQGRIALVRRGTITFAEKVARVAEAGALAAVIYNDGPGPFLGALATDAPIPAVSISGEDGQALLNLLAEGEVRVTVSLAVRERQSRNVVAVKPGLDATAGIVVLGAHYDTVPGVAGANDNGSGVATLLAIGGRVAGTAYPFEVRLVAFGAEELGLLGSQAYLDALSAEERPRVTAMLAFDALGTGPVAAVEGTAALTDRVLAYGAAHGLRVEARPPVAGLSSDHRVFQDAGIPAVLFVADDLSRIHTAADVMAFVRPDLLGTAAALALGLLESLAGPGR